MAKHAKKSEHLQVVDPPKTTAVEIPLPLQEAFASIENSFFTLRVKTGQQVLAAMREQDREDLWGGFGCGFGCLWIRVPVDSGATHPCVDSAA